MAYFYHGNISPLELSVNGTSKFKGTDTSTPGILQIYDNDSTNYTQIQAAGTLSANYTLTLPTTDGDANQLLQTNGSGTLSWTNGITLSGSALTGLIENNSIWLGNDPNSTTDTAEKNTAVGIGSLDAITTGDHNVAIGYNSGTAINSGYKNVLLGSLAGQAITTGYQNIAIGTVAGNTITEGYHNIYIGDGAGYWSTTSTENICIGTYTGQQLTIGSKNTFVGQESGNSNSEIVPLTGHENTCLGYKSGFNVQGSSQYNTLIGSRSGDSITTGTENVIVGYNSDPSSATGTNQIVIGSGTTGQGDNKVVIGNSSITDVYMAADASATVRCGSLLAETSTNSADIIKLHADAGELQTITILNDEGTNDAAIALTSTAGGVNIDAAAAKDVNIAGGQVAIVSKDNVDSAISLTTNIGAIETIKITNSQGTSEDAIGLTSIAGGINITSAAGTAGIIKMNPGTGGLITKRAVQTITDSANDATASQYVAGFINCTGGGADTWTLPDGVSLADAMPSDTVTVGDSFICYVVNASGGDITYAPGASGCTISSSGGGTLVQKNLSLAQLHFIFTVATDGSEEYHCLLIADNS